MKTTFQKKNRVVAEQYRNGNEDGVCRCLSAVMSWQDAAVLCGPAPHLEKPHLHQGGDYVVFLRPGDWIVTDGKRQFVMSAKDFHDEYERVVESKGDCGMDDDCG